MYKIGKSGGFLGRVLGPLIKTGLSLIGNVIKPSAKRVLIPLQLTAEPSVADAAIHKEMFRSGVPLDLVSRNTTVIISNEGINNIMKIIKSFEKSG